MAKSTDSSAPKAANNDLDTVLDLATAKTKSEMGATPTNKTVNTTVAMTSSVTENGSTTETNVNAGVTLGTSTKTTPEAK